jgi:hypothetical protein
VAAAVRAVLGSKNLLRFFDVASSSGMRQFGAIAFSSVIWQPKIYCSSATLREREILLECFRKCLRAKYSLRLLRFVWTPRLAKIPAIPFAERSWFNCAAKSASRDEDADSSRVLRLISFSRNLTSKFFSVRYIITHLDRN